MVSPGVGGASAGQEGSGSGRRTRTTGPEICHMTEALIRRTSNSTVHTVHALESLDLSYKSSRGKIRVLENLNGLTRLQKLVLKGNELVSTTHVSVVTTLRLLNVAHCGLFTLQGLNTLQTLTTLDCSQNSLESLSFLVPLRLLQNLSAHNNKLANLGDLDAAQQLSHLSTLTLRGNPVASLSHYRLAVIDKLRTINSLDDISVGDAERQQARIRFQVGLADSLRQSLTEQKSHAEKMALKAFKMERQVEQEMQQRQQVQGEANEWHKAAQTAAVQYEAQQQVIDKQRKLIQRLVGDHQRMQESVDKALQDNRAVNTAMKMALSAALKADPTRNSPEHSLSKVRGEIDSEVLGQYTPVGSTDYEIAAAKKMLSSAVNEIASTSPFTVSKLEKRGDDSVQVQNLASSRASKQQVLNFNSPRVDDDEDAAGRADGKGKPRAQELEGLEEYASPALARNDFVTRVVRGGMAEALSRTSAGQQQSQLSPTSFAVSYTTPSRGTAGIRKRFAPLSSDVGDEASQARESLPPLHPDDLADAEDLARSKNALNGGSENDGAIVSLKPDRDQSVSGQPAAALQNQGVFLKAADVAPLDSKVHDVHVSECEPRQRGSLSLPEGPQQQLVKAFASTRTLRTLLLQALRAAGCSESGMYKDLEDSVLGSNAASADDIQLLAQTLEKSAAVLPVLVEHCEQKIQAADSLFSKSGRVKPLKSNISLPFAGSSRFSTTDGMRSLPPARARSPGADVPMFSGSYAGAPRGDIQSSLMFSPRAVAVRHATTDGGAAAMEGSSISVSQRWMRRGREEYNSNSTYGIQETGPRFDTYSLYG